MSKILKALGGVFCAFALAVFAEQVYATQTFDAFTTTGSGDLTVSQAPGSTLTLGNASSTISGGMGGPGQVVVNSLLGVGTVGSGVVLPSDGHSYQAISGDANPGAGFGSSSFTGPKFGAGVMGNIHGSSLTGTDNYLGGVIGDYSLMGSPSSLSVYPKGGVLGLIGSDGPTTGADGAIVAVLDGDGGVVTSTAAFKVVNLNSTPGSHFNWGLDLMGPAIDSGAGDATHYPAVTYGVGDIRLQKGDRIVNPSAGTISFGSANLTTTGTLTASSTALTGSITLATSTVMGDLNVTNGKILLNTTFAADGTSGRGIRSNVTLPSTFGSSNVVDPRNASGLWGSINGSALTQTANYMAGVIGEYNITGSNASTYPKAGVIGWIAGDGPVSVGADAAVLALLDGDSGVVNANAAFGVRYANSTAGSGFNYGLDLSGPKLISSNIATAYLKSDIRLSSGVVVMTGAGAPATGTCNTATVPNGSMYLNSTPTDASTVMYVCFSAAPNGNWTAK